MTYSKTETNLLAEMQEFLDLVTVKRPSCDPETYKIGSDLMDRYGFTQDAHGNGYVVVGDNPKVCFSAHYDTVHGQTGKNPVVYGDGIMSVLDTKQKLGCLGADDAAGIYIITEMIKAERPGLYILFADEEMGGVGSSKFDIKIMEGMDMMVSFDRMGYTDVITHQGGDRCASDDCALWFAGALNSVNPAMFEYSPNPAGFFTDSKNFIGVVPECFNLSVGYFNQHTVRETQDMGFLYKLAEALKLVDFTKAPIVRIAEEPSPYTGWSGGGSDWWLDDDDLMDGGASEMDALIKKNPEIVSDFLLDEGYSIRDLENYMWACGMAEQGIVED